MGPGASRNVLKQKKDTRPDKPALLKKESRTDAIRKAISKLNVNRF